MKEKLLKLKRDVENVEVSYNYEDTYFKLYNLIIEYQNDTNSYSFEYLFERFATIDVAEDIAKKELEQSRIVCFTMFFKRL